MGQGLGRRPGDTDRGRARRAEAGPAARAEGRLPGGGARGRDGRRLRLLPARQGRGRAVHRHRDARPGRRRPRRPPAPGLRHRAVLRRRRRGPHQGVLRRRGGLGALAPPRLPARPGHRRRQGRQPAGHRLRPRRPRHHRLGHHLGRMRGELAAHDPYRRGLPPCGAARPSPSAPYSTVTSRCPPPTGVRVPPRSRPRCARSPPPTAPRSATSPTPSPSWTSWPAPGTRASPRSAPPAPTTSCAPRSARSSSTSPPGPRWTRPSRA